MKKFARLSLTLFKTIIVFALVAAAIPSQAQLLPPLWDTALGTWGGNYQNGGGIKAGWDNNVYISYRYTGTINLNPVAPASGCGTAIGTAQLTNRLKGKWATQVQQSCGYDYNMGFNIDDKLNSYAVGIISSGGGWFCGKTDVNGNFKWDFKVTSGSPYASGVCTDNTGHDYICGGYGSTMTVGSNTLTYLGGGTDGFLVKIDSNENVLWAVRLAGTGNDCPTRCQMDHLGHVWVCGGYTGTPTFGTITLPASASYSSLFVAEYDTATGNCLKVYTAINCGTNGIFNDGMVSMVIDSCNNMYIAGPYQGTAQWGTFSASSTNANFYVAKMLANGTFQWVQTSSSASQESGFELTLDKNWDITTTGMFDNSATFSGHSLTGSSQGSVFAAKYASGNGAFMYAQAGGGTSAQTGGAQIAADTNRQIYIIGSYYTASPVFGTVTLPWGGDQAIYVAKLDSTPSLHIIPNPQTSYCAGQCYTLPFTAVYDSATGNFRAGNMFTAQLSDMNGSFASGGVNLGTFSSTTSGNIAICFPDTLTAGTNYQIRITSSSPAYCSIVRCGTLTINPEPTVTLSAPPTICQGDSATLTASGGVAYTWDNGATSSAITVKPGTNTTFSVSVSNGTCSKDTSILVTVNPLPAVTFTGNNNICIGDSTTITASGGVSYSWSNGATSSAITVKPGTNTTYSVSVNNGSCTKDTTFSVTVSNPPSITLSGNTSICPGDSTTISATGGGTYSWSNGSTNDSSSFKPVTTTTYTLTVDNGCAKDTVITITVLPTPVPSVSPTQYICPGASASLSASGGSSYSWNTGATSDSISVAPASTTTYTVSVSNGACSAIDSSTVVVYPAPLVTVVGTNTITQGDQTPLLATPGFSYTWYPSSSLSCDTCNNPLATPTVTTWYYVTVTDSNGCSIVDSVLITVKEKCGDIYVPTAFSPNGDGWNDVLFVMGNCIQSMTFDIYDRWGNKVFESNDPKIGWDGTFKGQPMNAGTYVFILTATDFSNNTSTKKGNVTLVR